MTAELTSRVRAALERVDAQIATRRTQRVREATSLLEDLGFAIDAAAVTGSTARGWFSNDSDVDITCLHRGPSRADETRVVGDIEFNLIYYSLEELEQYFPKRFADLAQLRLAANLETAIVLRGQSLWTSLRNVNRRLTLSPELQTYFESLSRERRNSIVGQQGAQFLLTANECLQACLVLVLSLCPIRLIKPRWTVHSVRIVDQVLLEALTGLIRSPLAAVVEQTASVATNDNPFSHERYGTGLWQDWQRQQVRTGPNSLEAQFLGMCVAARIVAIDDSMFRRPLSSTEQAICVHHLDVVLGRATTLINQLRTEELSFTQSRMEA